MTTPNYIEQRIASHDDDIFQTATNRAALIYTNSHDMLLGCSNTSNYISVNDSNTLIGGDIVINGDIIKKNSDGSTIVINNSLNNTPSINTIGEQHIVDSNIGPDKVRSVTGNDETFVLQEQPTIIAPIIKSGYIVSQGEPQPLIISRNEIADSAVTGSKIADYSITNLTLADNSVDSRNIVDGSIQTADLANSSIVESKIANAA